MTLYFLVNDRNRTLPGYTRDFDTASQRAVEIKLTGCIMVAGQVKAEFKDGVDLTYLELKSEYESERDAEEAWLRHAENGPGNSPYEDQLEMWDPQISGLR